MGGLHRRMTVLPFQRTSVNNNIKQTMLEGFHYKFEHFSSTTDPQNHKHTSVSHCQQNK